MARVRACVDKQNGCALKVLWCLICNGKVISCLHRVLDFNDAAIKIWQATHAALLLVAGK